MTRVVVLGTVPLREGELLQLVLASGPTRTVLTTWNIGTTELLVTDDGASKWALDLLAQWRGSPIRVRAA